MYEYEWWCMMMKDDAWWWRMMHDDEWWWMMLHYDEWWWWQDDDRMMTGWWQDDDRIMIGLWQDDDRMCFFKVVPIIFCDCEIFSLLSSWAIKNPNVIHFQNQGVRYQGTIVFLWRIKLFYKVTIWLIYIATFILR